MIERVYPDVNTSAASNTAANQAIHRQGEDINTKDQLSSVVLLGLAVAGAAAAVLLISLLVG